MGNVHHVEDDPLNESSSALQDDAAITPCAG